jgi:hypothetical protein
MRSLRSARSRAKVRSSSAPAPAIADHVGGQDRCNFPGFGQSRPSGAMQDSTKPVGTAPLFIESNWVGRRQPRANVRPSPLASRAATTLCRSELPLRHFDGPKLRFCSRPNLRVPLGQLPAHIGHAAALARFSKADITSARGFDHNGGFRSFAISTEPATWYSIPDPTNN